MAKRQDVIDQLNTLGIPVDEKMTVPELEAVLNENKKSIPVVTVPAAEPTPDSIPIKMGEIVPPETVTMTKEDLDALLKRTVSEAVKQVKESLNDPMPILKKKINFHTVKVAMYKGKYVISFKNIQTNPQNRPLYFSDEFNPNRKRIEEYVTVNYADGSSEKVCYLDFMNELSKVVCRITHTDKETEVKQYVGLTDPGLTGDDPREVIFEETIDHYKYTVQTPSTDAEPQGSLLEIDATFVNM